MEAQRWLKGLWDEKNTEQQKREGRGKILELVEGATRDSFWLKPGMQGESVQGKRMIRVG